MKRNKLMMLAPALGVLTILACSFALQTNADAARRDGETPSQVICNPTSAPSGTQVNMQVTLSSAPSQDQKVNLSYGVEGGKLAHSANGVAEPYIFGPSSVTVSAGNTTASASITVNGSSGDTDTITATCNGGNAQGTVGVE